MRVLQFLRCLQPQQTTSQELGRQLLITQQLQPTPLHQQLVNVQRQLRLPLPLIQTLRQASLP